MICIDSNDFEVNNIDFGCNLKSNTNGNTKECQLTKCGKIFMSNSLENFELFLKCCYCNEFYSEVKDFKQHLINKHLLVPKTYANGETKVNPGAIENETNKLDQIEFLIDDAHLEMLLESGYAINETKVPLEESNFSKPENDINELQVPVKEYKCIKCPKSFKTKYNMKTHVYTHSQNKPFKCHLCPRSYVNNQNLKVHLRRHNGNKPFECEQCFRNFATSTEKKIHLRSHNGEKPYICLECGSAHTTASQLLEHRRSIHLDERNFKCEECFKGFHTKNHLKSHQEAIHTLSSFVCSTCNLSYKTNFYLKAHMKIHFEKTYKCTLCGKEFSQHSALYQHRKTHIRRGEIGEIVIDDGIS